MAARSSSGAPAVAVTGPAEFAAAFDVSRETVDRLVTYECLLKQWQNAVNLVAPSTLDHVWQRHFADSAQIVPLIPHGALTLVDLGSGAGFPGLVTAILLADPARPDPAPAITLVESDQRKAAFLREVARAVEIAVDIVSTRIEASATVHRIRGVDVVTARALARLQRLFELIAPIAGPRTVSLLLKGRDAETEIDEARERYAFDCALHPSRTDSEARLLVVRHLRAKTEG